MPCSSSSGACIGVCGCPPKSAMNTCAQLMASLGVFSGDDRSIGRGVSLPSSKLAAWSLVIVLVEPVWSCGTTKKLGVVYLCRVLPHDKDFFAVRKDRHERTKIAARQWTNTAHGKDLMHGARLCLVFLTNTRQSKSLPSVSNKRTAKKSLPTVSVRQKCKN
jgi:hypothetical protein